MDELLCPCQVVIPMDYNPDHEDEPPREVEPEVFAGIISLIVTRFGDYSLVTPPPPGGMASGSWRGQADRSYRIEVGLPQRRTHEFVEVVYEIGKRLRQKAMYYVILPPSARVMPIDNESA